MSFKWKKSSDGSMALRDTTTGTDVFTVTAADVIAFNATSITMTREAIAAIGATAANGASLTKQISAVTAANGTRAAVLPAAATTVGPLLVINTVATTGATLPVFPVSGGDDAINGLGANNAFTMGPGQAVWFVPVSATQWYAKAAAAATSTVAEMNILTGVTATGPEITRVNSASARMVATTATALALTATQHGERVVLVNTNATIATITLPAATGTGNKYVVINNIAQTQGSIIIQGNVTTDVFKGVALMVNTSTTVNAIASLTSATTTKVTWNRTTTGGAGPGDYFEAWDSAAATWTVQVRAGTVGAAATPFSA